MRQGCVCTYLFRHRVKVRAFVSLFHLRCSSYWLHRLIQIFVLLLYSVTLSGMFGRLLCF